MQPCLIIDNGSTISYLCAISIQKEHGVTFEEKKMKSRRKSKSKKENVMFLRGLEEQN